MWKIADVEIENRIVLAPMAGISNSAYRRIVKEMGCGLIFAEMVSDKAISHGNQKTLDMLYMREEERPIAQQIFGSDKESFEDAAKKIYEEMNPDIIDINMGCPVPKIAVKSQAGSALLKDPEKVYKIIKAVNDAVPVPVTVKIRSGWDHNSINAVEIAKIAEKAGASAISVHGRTRSQGYSGLADWDIIKQVKEAVSIPVIGNGDVKDIESAIKMFEETKCDAIMIGRGAIGNPWIFKQLDEYYKTGKIIEGPKPEEKFAMMKKHLNYLLEFKDEKLAVLEMRTHASAYLKGIKGANHFKPKLFEANTKEEFIKKIEEFEREIKNG